MECLALEEKCSRKVKISNCYTQMKVDLKMTLIDSHDFQKIEGAIRYYFALAIPHAISQKENVYPFKMFCTILRASLLPLFFRHDKIAFCPRRICCLAAGIFRL